MTNVGASREQQAARSIEGYASTVCNQGEEGKGRIWAKKTKINKKVAKTRAVNPGAKEEYVKRSSPWQRGGGPSVH